MFGLFRTVTLNVNQQIKFETKQKQNLAMSVICKTLIISRLT